MISSFNFGLCPKEGVTLFFVTFSLYIFLFVIGSGFNRGDVISPFYLLSCFMCK